MNATLQIDPFRLKMVILRVEILRVERGLHCSSRAVHWESFGFIVHPLWSTDSFEWCTLHVLWSKSV